MLSAGGPRFFFGRIRWFIRGAPGHRFVDGLMDWSSTGLHAGAVVGLREPVLQRVCHPKCLFAPSNHGLDRALRAGREEVD